MSNLSDLLPAGAGGKQVSFTADGAISQGDTVALQTDGTVKAVTETNVSQGLGSSVVFETGYTAEICSAYDSTNGKVVVAYQDVGNSNYGTAVVGTVSGTSISFGSPVVFESAFVRYTDIVYDSNSGKIVIVYQDQANSEKGTAIVGTVSGTSISFGSAALFNNGVTTWIRAAFDSTNNKVVVVYQDESNSNKGTGVVGTVSGTSISFGSEGIFNTGTSGSNQTSITYDSGNEKIVVAFRNASNSSYGTAVVGTVSGTSISFGALTVFESAFTEYTSAAFDTVNGKAVISYRDAGNSDRGTAIVGTVSGTSISFGTAIVFDSTASRFFSSAYHAASGTVLTVYADGSDDGSVIPLTVSGTSVSAGTKVTFFSGNMGGGPTACTYDSANAKVVISYRNIGVSSRGTSVVFNPAYSVTNYTDFIGIADAAISDTASGNITIKGGIASNGLSGLTPNATYYVQDDGTLSTTSSSVTAGKALSATSINLDYSS